METVILGKRLLLQDFTPEDFEAVHDYAQRMETVRYMEWGPNSPEETRGFLDRAVEEIHREPRRDFQLAVWEKRTDRLIGGARISISDPGSAQGSIGYVLHPDHWGNGFGTEIAVLLLRFGFGSLELNRILAVCDVDNAASVRILEKVGMTREGRLRENTLIRGEFRDQYQLAILQADWIPDLHPQVPPIEGLDDTWISE